MDTIKIKDGEEVEPIFPPPIFKEILDQNAEILRMNTMILALSTQVRFVIKKSGEIDREIL